MSDFTTESLLKGLSNYPVSKGDLPGHEFRGNQYTAGQLSDLAGRIGKMSSDHYVVAKQHKDLAAKHIQLANQFGQKTSKGKVHVVAALAHMNAHTLHMIGDKLGEGRYDPAELATETAKESSVRAAKTGEPK